MHLFTDSKSLFDIMSKGSSASEKRITLDIHAARQGHKEQKTSNIGFARSSANLAGGLPKHKMRNGLVEMLKKDTHIAQCEQMILRW